MLGDFIDWLILELLKLKCNRYGLEIGLDANDRWLNLLFFFVFLEAWCLIQANCYKDLALIYILCIMTKTKLVVFDYSKGRTCPYVQFLLRFGARTLEPRTITKKSIKDSCFACCWDNSLWLCLLFCRRQCERMTKPLLDFSQYCDHNNNNLSLPCRVVRPHGIFPN